MADPFEVRLRFTNLLTHLSASTTSSLKTASFALKHRDMDEDLHSCILESLEAPTTSVNSRANIMYFLEHFCDMAMKENHGAYVEMVQRDMLKIVGAVISGAAGTAGGGGVGSKGTAVAAAAAGGGGAANIKVARKVVADLERRGWLNGEVVKAIDEDLKRREAERNQLLLLEEGGSAATTAANTIGTSTAGTTSDDLADRRTGTGSERERHRSENRGDRKDATGKSRDGGKSSNGTTSMTLNRVDKRAIEQRIEEDRERNKRLRESVWAVNGEDEDEELNRLWEETSDLCEDDYAIAREEADERAQFARFHRMLMQEGR